MLHDQLEFCGDEWLEFEQFLSAMKAVAHLLELQEPSTLSSSMAVIGHGLFRGRFRSPEYLDLLVGERVLAALKLAGVSSSCYRPTTQAVRFDWAAG